MQISPHLNFNGQCEEAFRFYETCLNGEIVTLMRFEESPLAAQAPAGWGKKIIHATLAFGDRLGLTAGGRLTGADAGPEHYRRPQGFSVLLEVNSAEDAERIYTELSAGGTIRMPLGETSWAVRFGAFVDRFGTPWMIHCARPAA